MSLIDTSDSLERQNEKLLKIARALMRRVEQEANQAGLAYAQFERAAILEDQVRRRTRELEEALDLLHRSNLRLAEANRATEEARANLSDAIETVREGFALFGADSRLVLHNSRFCRDLADVAKRLSPGLLFEEYVTLVSTSSALALPPGMAPETWARERLKRHREKHVIFNVELSGDRWVQVSEHRTREGGTVVMQTDVTDIIRTERLERDRLRDKQARMIRATLDHLNQGVAIFDEKGRLVGWNALVAELLKLPVSELRVGQRFSVLVDRLYGTIRLDEDTGTHSLLGWAYRPQRRRPFACEAIRNDGRILDLFAQEMPDRGFVISFTDVTAEREAAQALREANELLEQRVADRTNELADALDAAERANATKSRFVAAASHDLLQPLSAAKLFVSALAGRDLPEEDAVVIAKTESALSSAEAIINALLDISRLDSGHAEFDVRPLQIGGILQALRQQLEPAATAKGIELSVVDCSLTVMSDAGYLRRILQNLATNAIRYTERGKVLIGVRRNGDSARIEVWDTGPGIPQEDRATIFEEFRRLNARASAQEGLGLGLAIVKRACLKLGHDLDLWSQPGRGSGFFVNLPVGGNPPDEVLPLSDGVAPADLRDLGLIVLLVENDRTLRRAICYTLESRGVDVIDVENAAEALELLGDLGIMPDGLILDYQLGDGPNGLELLSEIRRRFGDRPACIISAERSVGFRHECEAAAAELLTKPLDQGKLCGFLAGIRGGPAEG